MRKTMVLAALLVTLVAFVPCAQAQTNIITRMRAYDEVPALSTPGVGFFQGTISADRSTITYQLSYTNLAGKVLQSHIHIGQEGVNGGIMIFLCSNLGNGPAGTQACPPPPATITGTLTAAGVIGPSSQGVAPGQIFFVSRAILASRAYANLHTDLFPAGEIRGQIKVQQ
jgi:hypothetical protein